MSALSASVSSASDFNTSVDLGVLAILTTGASCSAVVCFLLNPEVVVPSGLVSSNFSQPISSSGISSAAFSSVTSGAFVCFAGAFCSVTGIFGTRAIVPSVCFSTEYES